MYEVIVSFLTWTAVGAACHFLVVALRMKLADRRRTVFTEKTYGTACDKALANTKAAADIYRSVPRGAVSNESYRLFAKRQDHFLLLKDRWARERPNDASRY